MGICPDPAKRDPLSFGNVSTTPRKLEWDMAPELSIALRFAESHLADLLQQHEFQVLDFAGYGKPLLPQWGFPQMLLYKWPSKQPIMVSTVA